MVEIRIGFSKFRAWEEDRPELVYTTQDVLEYDILAVARAGAQRRRVTLEAFVPCGAMARYGLLGGDFDPDDTNRLAVRVYLSNPDGRTFPAAIAGSVDDVRIGLPVEYGRGVLEGVVRAQASVASLSPGTLVIHRAAHGMVGSSPLHFGRLAEALVNLLAADTLDSAALTAAGRLLLDDDG